MAKPSFMKVEMSFAEFASAFMDWADGLICEDYQKKVYKMVPTLYEDKAIVAITAIVAATLKYLGPDFDWWGERTAEQDEAVEEYRNYSAVLYTLVDDCTDTIEFYKDRDGWLAKLGI